MATQTKFPELSVVIAFGDCEESIGRRIGAWADRLTTLGRSFEIIAVNEGSRDNSVAVLALLAQRIPELRVIGRDVKGRAFARGALEARAGTILLARCHADVEAGAASMIPLGWALGRLDAGRDAVVVRGRFLVARTGVVLAHVTRARGTSAGFEPWFERAAAPSLRLQVVGTRRSATGLRHRVGASMQDVRTSVLAPLRRLIFAFGTSR